ncbi:MAG: TetR/AcrR family transcriptional regulator [Bacteroidota bacterium]
MNERKRQEWIAEGYQLVAQNGFERLTVKLICRMVAKSKSSFYHYFGELELFKDALLTHHAKRAHQFARDIDACQQVEPDLVTVLMDYRTDIFFYKQVRMYRDHSTYKKYGQQIFDLYENAVLEKWVDYFKLNDRPLFARKFNKFLSEHFLMSISFDTYTRDWLKNYLFELWEMVHQLKKGN